ncbi:MAG: N-acetylmuramic acid 6-phosphate etherase [Niabella sp.]
MKKITEQPSLYNDLEKKAIPELTEGLIKEYSKIAAAIDTAKPQLDTFLEKAVEKLRAGGRLIYLGAGSGGRLSVMDIIELPVTYGMEKWQIDAVLAGGVDKLVLALEEKEDDTEEAWKVLQEKNISDRDIVLGISASGTTPFVLHGLKNCKENNITTGALVSNYQTPIAALADFPIEVITGPEFVTGSTRMKAGTAQKMIFDMISTSCMIQLGRVKDNKMINVLMINDKITDRAVRIMMEQGNLTDYDHAKKILFQYGSVASALEAAGEWR